MIQRIKMLVRNLAVRFFQVIGTPIRDARSGEIIDRAFLICWSGKLHFLGLRKALVPSPLPQKRLTYWHQSLGFTIHPVPDFARREPVLSLVRETPPEGPRPAVVILDHRAPRLVAHLVKLWVPTFCSADSLILAYGGSEAHFQSIDHPLKTFVADGRLRTRDHQREGQSYRGVFRAVTELIRDRDFTHILFMESDHLPLVPELLSHYLARLEVEDADVLGYQLQRMDRTLHPHYLNALAAGWDDEVTLSMLGTGHFWTRQAWDAVADSDSSDRLYLEMDLPTVAHRAGFRVRPLTGQEEFVQAQARLLPGNQEAARRAGAWSIHPVKLR